MCLHTKPLIFHRKEEGLPPLRQLLCPTQGCLYLTVPLAYSPYRSLFLQHMPVVMLMSVTGSASQSGRPSHLPPQQAEVCNYRAVLGWMVWLVGWLRSADRRCLSSLKTCAPIGILGQETGHTWHGQLWGRPLCTGCGITSPPSLSSSFLLLAFSSKFHHERPAAICPTSA